MITRSLAPVLVLLVFSPFLSAQMETSANCDLSVDVRTSDERTIEVQIQVELLSPQGVIATAHSVGTEPAQFRVANARTYRLRVSGGGMETTITPFFEISALEHIHTETVHVKPEKLAGESAPGSPTISVIELNAPRKASAEMNKGME